MVDLDRLESLAADGYLRRKHHDTFPLTIWNYTQKAQFDRFWTPETLMCRGLVTQGDEIVSRPFSKFFNWEEIQDKPTGSWEAFEKYDGSLICVSDVGRIDPLITTRGSFDNEQVQRARLMLEGFRPIPGYTYCFEIVYPENRIVVDYGSEEFLVLLGVIDIESGQDVSLDLDWSWGNKAERITAETLDDLMATDRPNHEGFVLRFEDGTRAKVKHAEYKRLHALLTGIDNVKIWEVLRNGSSLEWLETVPDEFFQWAQSIQSALSEGYDSLFEQAMSVFSQLPKNDRASFAAQATKQGTITPILFALLDGKEDKAQDICWKLVKPERGMPFWNDEVAA